MKRGELIDTDDGGFRYLRRWKRSYGERRVLLLLEYFLNW